jgi:hypothetical protein
MGSNDSKPARSGKKIQAPDITQKAREFFLALYSVVFNYARKQLASTGRIYEVTM